MNKISDQRGFHALLRHDFGAFNHKVFNTLHKGASYDHNWHIDAIAQALSGVYTGEDQRLMILQPPQIAQIDHNLCGLGGVVPRA